MNISAIINCLPSSVKCDIIDITDVKTKEGKPAMRITLDRELTDSELTTLQRNRHIPYIGLTRHRYAPEIAKSYFYYV